MGICREVDGRERDIASQTSCCAFVETDQTQVADDPYSRPLRGSLDALLDRFALNLESNFDDFERVGEDLQRRNKPNQ